MDGTAPTAEELLAHTDWLTRLARALAGDAAAGDVVQETYEVALARPPRRDGPLRPWLGGVARNIARMTARGRARRERREEQAAPALEVPTPEDLVARAEMQQQVARVVLELDEPLRGTLLLRYFEGMSAAEIARAQGVPPATVRSRLKDALDRVRATLDRRHGGERRRWIVLVAPLPALAAARPAAAATLTRGLLVKTVIKIAVAALVLLAVVLGTRWAGLWGASQDPPPEAAAAAAAPRKPPAPRPVSAASASAGQAASVADDDPRGTLRLEGQVIDERDQPVGGAAVAIDANPPIVVETEADGSFVFEGLIPRHYRVEASKADGYAGPARLRLVGETEAITLRMRRGGAVEVAVVERPGGKPVAGAEIELRSTLTWRATTDARGVATLSGVGPLWAPLAVRAAGYAPGALMIGTSGDPAAPERVSVALSRGAAVAGRVVDEAGRPITGARVVATPASEPFPVVDPRRDGVLTGEGGGFELPALSAGTWRLVATHGDHAPSTGAPLTVDGTLRRDGVELVLSPGGVVRGVVRDPAGRPVASADVRVVLRGYVFWRARRQAFSGADGRFEIAGLPRRALDVVASHDTGASAIAAADLAGARERELALVLDVTGVLEGVVVDRAGAPVGDAQVVAAPELSPAQLAERGAWGVRGVPEAVTDQGGRFRFAGLPDGPYRVRAARPGTAPDAMSLSPGALARPRDPPLRLVLVGDGRVVGKVAFADGTAAPAFTVAVGATHPIPFTGADGAFALPTLAGTHALVIAGPGFARKAVYDVAIAEGKDTDLGTITVAEGRSVSGRVLDASGAPVPNAKVAAGFILSGGGSELYLKQDSIDTKDTETDAHGRFALDGFSTKMITVVAGKDGIGRSESTRVPAGTESATLDLVLQPTAALEGKITRGGAPVPDAIVIAAPIGAINSNFFVQTGPDGTYAHDALAPGAYLVYPMLGQGGSRPKDMYVRRIEVTPGKRTRGDIDATPGPVTLTVSIRTDAGAPVPLAHVVVMQTAIDPKTMDELRDGTRLPPIGDETIQTYIRVASDGTLEIPGARAGVHTVCASPVTQRPDDPLRSKLACVQVRLGARPQHQAELVFPAAWVPPRK